MPKVKMDERGICYVAGFMRYTTVFLDLLTLIFLLYVTSFSFNYIFIDGSNRELFKVMEKYSMQMPLAKEEEIIKNRQIKLILANQVVQFIALFIFIISMWVKFAATPAKLLFGFRVVDATTLKKITFKQAVKRFFTSILSAIPLFLGFIWANFDKRGQTWHDKIANTVIVTNKSLLHYYKAMDKLYNI